MPVINLVAVQLQNLVTEQRYICPVFVTGARGGTYVTEAQLQTDVDPRQWVLAGVGLLLSLDN